MEDCQRQRFGTAIALLWATCAAGVQLWSAPALACSCAQRSAAEAYEQAVSVFEGHVIDVQRLEPANGRNMPELKVRLAVVRSWKGMEQEQVELTTPVDAGACGYPFTKDGDYLVYASADTRGLSAGLCSRTRPIADATDDLRALGLGATPVDPHPPAGESSTNAPSASNQPKPLQPPRGGCAGCIVAPSSHRAPVAASWLTLCGVAALLRLRRRLHQPRAPH